MLLHSDTLTTAPEIYSVYKQFLKERIKNNADISELTVAINIFEMVKNGK